MHRLTPGLRIAAGIVLVLAGLVLATRPLTSVLVLILALAVAAVVAGVRVGRGTPAQPWRLPAAVALGLVGVALVVCLAGVAEVLPRAVAVLLVANAVRLGVRAARAGESAPRIARALAALASLPAAWCAWVWPDAATVVIAVAAALAVAVVGVRVVVDAVRGPRRGGRRPRRVLPVVAAALALVAASGVAGGSARLLSDVAPDGFYSWDAPIPATPGAILKVSGYDGEVPAGAKALRVLYATTYADGTPAVASAVVTWPTAAADAPRPVLAWQHGTTGVAVTCAPSLRDDALSEANIPGIGRAIERGWVVVATDYPGQGTGGRYPYLLGEGEGRSSLDAVRAARNLDEAQASAQTWLWGHSQGGHATLWAGQLAASYAPELEVLGVAALSAASDPLAMAERVTGAGGIVADLVTSYVLVPYADEYADVSLSSSVHPAGHGLVRAFAQRCATDAAMTVSALVGLAIQADAPLYRIDLTAGTMRDRLRENIADGLVGAPLFLGQGVDDETIPIQMQRDLDQGLCAMGETVETHEYPGRTHMGVIAADSPLIDDLFAWADAVEDGASPSTCATE